MNREQNRKIYYAVFALVLCALVVPVWLVEIPPLVDLPNHLARVFVLAHYADTPFFQENFQIVRQPIPNLAIDLIVLPLMKFFDIWTANRLFLTLMICLFAFGCHLTAARKSGEFSYSALPASFLIYSGTFFYGYVNYVFSVALFLISFGLWLRWRERLNLGRALALIALTAAIYLSHLSAFVFFGVAVFFVDAYDFLTRVEEHRTLKSLAVDAAFFVLPAIAFLAFMNNGGSVGVFRWNSFSGKAVALFSAFRSYDLWADLLCVAALGGLIYFLKRRKEIEFDKTLLLVASIFFVLFLLAPKYVFTGDADLRIVLPAFALLIASCRINFLSGKTFAAFAVLLCVFAVRQSAIAYRWFQMSGTLAAETKLLDAIAPQSKVYPLYFNDDAAANEKLERPVIHAVQFVTFKNSSIAATLFAFRGQQPLVFRRAGQYATPENQDETKWLELLGDSDYVWTRNAPQTVSDELERRAQLVAENEKTKIWKLNK